jgi:DNA processing protein
VAVLAHGLDRVYPPEHAELADAIVAGGGALVTEYQPGTPPERWRFAARDRAQVALCRAVVAVWSEPEGGTMHTVTHAARTGVPVLVPRDIPIGAGLAAAVRQGRANQVADADAAARAALRPSLLMGALFGG